MIYKNGQPMALYRNGQPMAIYHGGQKITGIRDPHYDNVVLLIEGSARDYSKYQHPVAAIGGAVFADGVFAGSKTTYFEVAMDEALGTIQFTSGNVFTLEWWSMDHDLTNDFGLAFGAGGTVSDGNFSALASTGATIANRGRNFVRFPAGGGYAGTIWHSAAAYIAEGLHHQAIVYDATGWRWYVDGAFNGQGGTRSTDPYKLSGGGKLHIGGGIPLRTAAYHGETFRSLRLTQGVARYTGTNAAVNGNFTPPASFLR
ncbi:MAG: hypothetical protein LBF61_02785 [Azoarcus sp.]|nr:hypothetical protein [Azoarcus sp.]